MVVSYKQTSNANGNASDNACRWDGHASPHYEVWFLTLNHRASRRGFWFRYTIDSTQHDALSPGETSAALWGAAFSRSDPTRNLGIRQKVSAEHMNLRNGDAVISIGDAYLSDSQAQGSVHDGRNRIDWNLRFEPCPTTYHHISQTLIKLARPSSFVCSPNLDTRFSGAINVNGESIVLDGEPGCQSHLWGRKHVDDWVWVHSNAFEGHSDTVFEGLAARPRRAGRAMPPIQSLYLRHRGEEHRLLRLRLAEQWQWRLGMGYWAFSAMNTSFYIEGTAQCRLRDMLQAKYVDPDGEPLFCANSEVANLKIRLFRRVHGIRWRHIDTIKAYGTAHLEHASRAIDPEIRLAF